jgi:DNA-binding transcriptional regulator YhcF (GntR family)
MLPELVQYVVCSKNGESLHMNTKTQVRHGISQFELSKLVLRNLNKWGLSPSTKLVLMALSDYYNPKNKDFYPSQQTMADVLGVNLSTVKRAIKELSGLGLIIYETKTVNRYKFTQKFFADLKLTLEEGQFELLDSGKLTHKQIKEKINNKQQSCPENLSFNPQTTVERPQRIFEAEKRKYHYDNQQKGINYKTPEATRAEIKAVLVRDDRSPFTDKETAVKFISELSEMMDNPVIQAQVERVKQKWGL